MKALTIDEAKEIHAELKAARERGALLPDGPAAALLLWVEQSAGAWIAIDAKLRRVREILAKWSDLGKAHQWGCGNDRPCEACELTEILEVGK